MKKAFIGFFVVVASLLVQPASAELSYTMPALEFGFKWNSMDLDGATSNKQTLGFQMGGSIVVDINETFGLRTGLFYSERPFKSDFVGGDASGKITYIDVPVHLMFMLEDYAGIYLGPSLSMKLGDEVTPGSLTGVKSTIVPIAFGGAFKVSENFGLNLFFETIASDLADGITASRGIGINGFLAF